MVDNQCTDNTSAVAKRYGCRVVIEPIRQISRARNTGAKAAKGANLIFVDADTIVPSDTFTQKPLMLFRKVILYVVERD